MTPTRRIALLGTHTPRQCGIATFTDDLAQAFARARPEAEVLVVAMNDGPTYACPPQVAMTVEQHVNRLRRETLTGAGVPPVNC